MHLDVDIGFAANFRKRPGRKFSDGYLVATVALEIPELSASEAAVVAPVVARFPYYGENKGRDGKRIEYEAREYDGRLLFPFDDDYVKRPQGDAAWLASTATDRDSDRGSPFKIPCRQCGTVRDADPDLDVATSSRDEAVALLMERASGCVLIDGRMWRSRPEPVIQATVVPGDGAGLVFKGRVRFLTDDVDSASAYRLDQSDLMERHYGDMLKSLDDLVFEPSEVEVLDASPLRLRTDEKCLLDAGKRLFLSMQATLKDAPVPFLLAYARLRDATNAFEDSFSADEACDVEDYSAAVREASEVDASSILVARALGAVARIEVASQESEALLGMSP